MLPPKHRRLLSKSDRCLGRTKRFGEGVPELRWLVHVEARREEIGRDSANERDMFENDVGDPLESEKSFCRDSSVWLSKTLSDGKPTEVTCHRLLPAQELR